MNTKDIFEELERQKKPKERHYVTYNCEHCEIPTTFKVIAKYYRGGTSEPPEEITFAFCEEFNYPALFVREDFGEGFDTDLFHRVFPPHGRYLGFQLPNQVSLSYGEAVRCENSKAWLACAVMTGRTLEAVCKDFDPSTKSIHKGLESLFHSGSISKEIHEWGNELRLLRNSGAHATHEVKREDAKDALDFLQVILEILYELRPKFIEFTGRRSRLTNTSKRPCG
jgi:hypothetical protein